MNEEEFLAEPVAPEFVERLRNMSTDEEESRARVLRTGLEDYDLDDEDFDVLEAEEGLEDGHYFLPALPVLAIVGRPNVGKSALVNRILGRREAVVEDKPGVTRDRVSYKAEWNERKFTLVDTGGWEPDARGIDKSVAIQAEIAVELADAVLFVVDAMVGATSTDERVVKMLRASGKPVILVANKIDDVRQEPEAANLWSLGLGEPYPCSAVHGRGVADLLDAAMKVLPKISNVAKEEIGGPRRVALIGRPNVGKSSLLNRAVGSERAVVNELAGTTRDPIDEQVELGGKAWRFVDTAGIRRRVHLTQGADFYASLRTAAALERAEVAVVLFDVTQPISEADIRIVDMALESGRALVLAFNKWDELDDERRKYLEREIEQDLAHVDWAPRVNISAKTGRHLEKLVPALEVALDSWDQRIATGKLNAFVQELAMETPHPVRGGKQPRILFATQASSRPPKFVLFTTGFLDPGYRRFITRRLRETYGFEGSPIEVGMRVREKRKR
ncbi:MAG: ribosome biogenesis GTPase Der [Actinobacteria bacterium]|jgi:GTP-binding protein|uniref:GTPase Der n=1 Tax=freshwater metagenome TaxID=449393 RepID=A0A6J6HL34_9ZZZZ|nr:ribosome biogenesis GTPase Der [Actinomycetota bacterium]